MEQMRQYAPYPTVLEKLVRQLRYRPGWTFELKDIERDPADTHGGAAGGLTFIGLTGAWGTHRSSDGEYSHRYQGTKDAYKAGEPRPVYFYFPVPAATYNEASWKRWLFDCIQDVERHEAMEHFQLEWEESAPIPVDSVILSDRPFAPTHGPGDNPYIIHEYAEDVKRRTTFRGFIEE